MLLISFSAICHAETKEIIAEGTYIMGDGETPSVAQERAVMLAKRAAIEQAGVYIESLSEIKNMQLTKDEIVAFTSGLVEASVIDKKRILKDNDSLQFWVKVRCLVNLDNVQAMRDKLQNKVALEDLKRIQNDYDKAMQEIDSLKKQLAETRNARAKKKIEAQIAQNENTFTALDWDKKAHEYSAKGDYPNAIRAYTEAIKLNPKNLAYYYNRGNNYLRNNQYDLAILDYSVAPNFWAALMNRGYAYFELGKYDLAINDYIKVEKMNSNFDELYFRRGNAYFMKHQYDLAIQDYKHLLEVNPQSYFVYYNIAYSYEQMGNDQAALYYYKLFLEYAPTNKNAGFAEKSITELSKSYSPIKAQKKLPAINREPSVR